MSHFLPVGTRVVVTSWTTDKKKTKYWIGTIEEIDKRLERYLISWGGKRAPTWQDEGEVFQFFIFLFLFIL
jgi:hypothetical protein